MDFWLNMALAVLFSTLKEVVKNPDKKAALQRALVKLRNQLSIAYPPDED